jgi:membrane associated rhomboid family serine protease
MLALWMFGADLERTWGTRQFLKFYCFCGVGAGIVVVLAQYLFGDPYRPTIGSSGAIYGVLMAYAVLFPDRTILFAFLFPIQARWFVLIIGAIAFLNTFKSINSPVSDIAHLSGLILAWVYMKMFLARARSRIPKASLVDLARQRYKAWQLERNKKKFQVYLRKHGSDRDWRN